MSKKNKKKTFQELELCDAFLFAATMEDVEICRKVLERILNMPISQVTVRSESPINFNPDYRSIRLDVYAADEDGTLYDIEMQTAKKRKQLPKRARFYHSQLDLTALKPGDKFESLPKSYIIFICTFDPFQTGLIQYSFENICQETNQPLGDETRKIFLNTTGTNDDQVPTDLKQFLRFVENANVATDSDDPLLIQLQNRIDQLKKNRRLERNYMLFAELLDDERMDGYNDGLADGQEMGQEKTTKLWATLLTMIKSEDLAALQNDPSLFSEMLNKYHISQI